MVVPGDAVLGDESGVLVLSALDAMRVGQQAIGLQDAEIVMLKRLADGERLPDITGATEVIESRLRRQA